MGQAILFRLWVIILTAAITGFAQLPLIPEKPVRVFLDTDIGDDIGDEDAVYALLQLCRLGYSDLVGAVTTTSVEYSPAELETFLLFAGCSTSIGAYQGAGLPSYSNHARQVVDRFGLTSKNSRSQYPEACRVYREVLSRSPDSSVVVVIIGFGTNFSALLKSPTDSFSGLNGRALVSTKVAKVVWMAGEFPPASQGEWNVVHDIASVRVIFDSCRVPIYFSGYEVGNSILAGAGIYGLPNDHPLKYAHQQYGSETRQAWDETAVLYAVLGLNGYFTDSGNGTVRLNNGLTAWSNAPLSNHHYLLKNRPDSDFAALINHLITKPLFVKPDRIPVLHITDLWHPHQDPDDHFDAAALFCLPGIDIKAVIIDQAYGAAGGDGLPVKQLNALSGLQVPYAMGSRTALASLTDSLPAALEQGGIRKILDVLSFSPTPVTVTSLGSCRDLAAAYNRNPALFHAKVNRVYLFAGDGAENSPVEWNVNLDPVAYSVILRSGLPVYWVPCFDGGLFVDGPLHRDSYWQASHGEILANASNGLWQYFIYMWNNLNPSTVDPMAYLTRPADAGLKSAFSGQVRNLWGSAVFGDITGRKFLHHPGIDRYLSADSADSIPAGYVTDTVFRWTDVEVDIGTDGITRYGHSATSQWVRRFSKANAVTYAKAMTDITADLLNKSKNWHDSVAVPVDTSGRLIARWDFEEAANDTFALDSAGLDDNGVLFNHPARVTGKTGQALRFDGLNGYVSVPWGQISGNARRTLSLWFNTTITTNSNWLSWGTDNPNSLCQLGTYNGKIGYLGYGNDLTLPQSGYLDGNWHHLAVTFNGSVLTLYMDGILKNTRATTLNTGVSPLNIGRAVNGAFYYNGMLDDIRIYDYALNNADIQNLYNGTPLSALTLGRANPAGRISFLCAPNPFNPVVRITVGNLDESSVFIRVFDMAGRKVATLRPGKTAVGLFSARWDGTAWPSGLYFIELNTPTRSIVQKIILQK